MHQTLFYIPKEIAGVSVFGVGWLLGLVVLIAIGTTVYLAVCAKRGTLDSSTSFGKELLGYIPFWALLAAIIIWVLPLIIKDDRGLPIRGFGTMLLVAVVAATLLNIWRGRRLGLSPDMVISLTFWLFVPGILGARIFYVIEYWDEFQRETLGATIGQLMSITEGGLVVYGSVIGGMFGILAFAIRHRLRFLAVTDMLAPSLMLGIAIGRIGCFLNGCCFGGACDLPWAVTFPLNSPPYMSQIERGELLGVRFDSDPHAPPVLPEVRPDSPAHEAGLRSGDRIIRINRKPIENSGELHQALLLAHTLDASELLTVEKKDGSIAQLPVIPLPERSIPVHPTQLYSSINALIACLFLLALSPFVRREGVLFATLMTIYPITRFLLEIIRTDEGAVFGTGLSISQNVSIIFLVCITGLWLYILLRKRPEPNSTSLPD